LVEVDKTLGKYIRGQLIVSSLVALMTTLGLLFLKIDYAIIIGAVAGISNIIPYFGPIIGAIPAIAIASLKSPASVLWVIIILIVVQQIESGIISPKVMGDSIGLHPVIVILTLIFGGKVFGFWGIILIMPVVAVIKAVITFMINNITGVDKE
jgi:predicted PurR-regulated permease PerM